ncbi:MAG: hypothetical protein ACOC2W_04310 [bacterium]
MEHKKVKKIQDDAKNMVKDKDKKVVIHNQIDEKDVKLKTLKESVVKNWKYELFNFKNSLTLDQLDISSVVEKHLYQFDKMSEKELTESLKMNLANYGYDVDVKKLLEKLEEEIESRPLVYDLKDLYKKVERRNYGMLYRDPLQKILDTISKDNDEARMESILSDLALYDWVPEIKVFVSNLMKSPVERQNYNSNGSSADKVFTVVESVEGGHIAFIGDRWFMLKEGTIEQCVVSDHVKDRNKLSVLEALEQAIKLADFKNELINFKIDENLTVSLSMDNRVFLNGEEADKESTLENLFNSPLVPFMKKNYYHIVEKVSKNLDKIVELDIATKISSTKRPLTETIAINYKDKMYLYSMDKRTGSSFFEYDSVNQLIQDVQREMEYDVTPFFENKLSKEMRHLRKLEDREKSIELKIKEVNESIDELKEVEGLMKESKELKEAFDNLLIHKHNLTKSLNDIRNQKNYEKKRV